jgi:hypothetical protein
LISGDDERLGRPAEISNCIDKGEHATCRKAICAVVGLQPQDANSILLAGIEPRSRQKAEPSER